MRAQIFGGPALFAILVSVALTFAPHRSAARAVPLLIQKNGGSSGRAIVSRLENGVLSFSECHIVSYTRERLDGCTRLSRHTLPAGERETLAAFDRRFEAHIERGLTNEAIAGYFGALGWGAAAGAGGAVAVGLSRYFVNVASLYDFLRQGLRGRAPRLMPISNPRFSVGMWGVITGLVVTVVSMADQLVESWGANGRWAALDVRQLVRPEGGAQFTEAQLDEVAGYFYEVFRSALIRTLVDLNEA